MAFEIEVIQLNHLPVLGSNHIFNFAKNNPCKAKLFSPFLGMSIGILTVSSVVLLTGEAFVKAVACLLASIFCCKNHLKQGLKFTLMTIFSPTILLPMMAIYSIFLTIFSIIGFTCNTKAFSEREIAKNRETLHEIGYEN